MVKGAMDLGGFRKGSRSNGRYIKGARIHQIMNRSLITVDKETSIDQAAYLLIDKRISCLPVVTDDGAIEGIVSWRDLLKAYAIPRSLLG
jgi:CBS-domain-containing membrane protein